MKKLAIIWAVFSTALTWPLEAQKVTGRVFAEENGKLEPLPYANVFWKIEKSGTVTDDHGLFVIDRPTKNDTLVVSFVGYKRLELYLRPGVRQLDSLILRPGNLLAEVEIREVVKGIDLDPKAIQLTQNIGKKELAKAACCNLSESFETNPVVESSFTDAISGIRQIELLGLSGKYTLLQTENIPTGRAMNQLLALSAIPGPWIESIQLTKGIGSVVNGFESMTGHINVELLKPESAPYLHLNGYVNNALRMEANALLGSVVTDHLSQHTLIHLNASPIPWDMNGDGFMDMPIGQQVNLQNKWKYSDGRRFEGQVGLRFLNDSRASGTMETPLLGALAGVQWPYRARERRWEFFTKNAFIFETEKPSSIGHIVSVHQHTSDRLYGNRRFDGHQWSLYQNLIYQSGDGSNQWIFKAGLSQQIDQVFGAFEDTSSVETYDQRTEVVHGAFAEISWIPSERFSAVAGGRVDYSNLFGFFATPRLHLRFAPWEGTVLRAHVGTGRRTPLLALESAQALMSNRRIFIASQLQQEHALNAGLSLQQDFRLNYRKGTITADIQRTYFYNQFIQDFDLHALEYHGYFNRGSSADHVMLQLDYEPMRRFETRLAYRRQWVFTEFTHQRLETPYVAPERWFANVAYSTRGNWKFDLTVNYFKSRRLPQTVEKGSFRVEDRSPDFWIVNGQINYTLKKGELYLGVENLLDLRQLNPVIAAGDPLHPAFDATIVWGPIFGRMVYAGINWQVF
ncbi:TonB-dependent receptor [Thermaurantimonas aggregans]|uniref:TonB-dependent receptor n=1 Tax=Thermaurantimonas aggregans TaxID=2173829 RepID=UPI0023F2FC18|nr:TonB-dependent receptor [Thermaurantimonas aggregans]MCX8148038.1 TonB-dependent receptor [Thermaurantimonas aggregans]